MTFPRFQAKWRQPRIPGWRREALRTNLWVVPSALIAVVGILWAVTYQVDRAAYRGEIRLPMWINSGSADAGRQVLFAIAAADITVVGVVFSITIVALTLASQQFGPRMLRNFIRDRGTQYTLGVFVSTFVFAILAIGSITSGGSHGDFVPHLEITVALVLVLADLGVLVYFIHHVATSIQLPQIVASIGKDLGVAIDTQVMLHTLPDEADEGPGHGPSIEELRRRLAIEGATIPAPTSGYLQFISRQRLIAVASRSGAVVRFLYHPGHFVVQGRPLAVVWPASEAAAIAKRLERAHATGSQRTLSQDLLFAIDQLVEIAIRALSPAVNDTFSALTCIDWLGAGVSRVSSQMLPSGVYRDRLGQIRLIEEVVSYPHMVNRAFDKIRQAGRAMPAVAIRQLASLAGIAASTTVPEERGALRRQADMILRASEEAVSEEHDRADIRRRYVDVLDALDQFDDIESPERPAPQGPSFPRRF
jgi:uncharacterized membrane protein